MSTKDEIATRLKAARIKKGFATPKAASDAFGWNENTYKSRENGTRGIPLDDLRRYARALGISYTWLATGHGDPSHTGVTLVGFAGADARPDAIVFAEGQGHLAHDLPAPPNAKPGTVAVQVRGDSMRGYAKDGWYIYYDSDDLHQPPFPDLHGETCVCWLADGRVLLKDIHPGTEAGLYNLESMNAPTLRDEKVAQATRVTAIIPNGKRPSTDALTPSTKSVKIDR